MRKFKICAPFILLLEILTKKTPHTLKLDEKYNKYKFKPSPICQKLI